MDRDKQEDRLGARRELAELIIKNLTIKSCVARATRFLVSRPRRIKETGSLVDLAAQTRETTIHRLLET